MQPAARNCFTSRGTAGIDFSPWPFPRTANGLSPAVLMGRPKVWEAASGEGTAHPQRAHERRIISVAFSPDGQRIVTGSGDQTAKVWEAASGRELLTLKGHTLRSVSVAFSPDGQRIVTGSADQTAKVWEAASGRELLTLKGHSARD